MSISLGEIAARYGCELRGDPDWQLSFCRRNMSKPVRPPRS